MTNESIVVVLHNNAKIRSSFSAVKGSTVTVLNKNEEATAVALIMKNTVKYCICTSDFDFSALAGRCRFIVWSRAAQRDPARAQELRGRGAWWVVPRGTSTRVLLETVEADWKPPSSSVIASGVGCCGMLSCPRIRPVRRQVHEHREALLDIEQERRRVADVIDVAQRTQSSSLVLNGTMVDLLPTSLGALTDLRSLSLSYSAVQALPPTIGKLTNLTTLHLHSSFDLHYLPFEILRCSKVGAQGFTVSVETLYGNYKNNRAFPALPAAPCGPLSLQELAGRTVVNAKMSIDGLPLALRERLAEHSSCSLCGEAYVDRATRCTVWTTRVFAGDVVPLLCHLCSPRCVAAVEAERFVDERLAGVPTPVSVAHFSDGYL